MTRPARTFWIIAVAVVLLDQITKSVVRILWDSPLDVFAWDALTRGWIAPRFALGESLPVLGEVLKLTYVRNAGAAFGLLPGYRPVFLVTSVTVLVVVAAYWRRDRPTAWPVVVGTALVSGGAFGNLLDRSVAAGKVTDFIHVAIIDFPVFNIADSAIFVGVVMLVGWLLFGPEPTVAGEGPGPSAVDEEPKPEAGPEPEGGAGQ